MKAPTTLAERVLSHLRAHPIAVDAHDVPREVTQEGISDAVGARVAHVSRALKTLVAEGLVAAHLAHPAGGTRRARAHALTPKGSQVAASLAPIGPARALAPAPAHAPSMAPIGREPQMRALLEALEKARASGPIVALVEGDAGSGKTRLLDAFAAEARARGALVASAAGAPVGDAQLVGPVGAALASLGFERRYRAHDAGTPRERALVAASEAVTGSAREAPVALVVDDVHLAGASVAEFLHGLALALPRGTRALLVIAFRREEAWALPNGPLYTALDPVRALPGATHVELPPLSPADIGRLLADADVHVQGDKELPDDLVARVARESGGNPFYALAMGEALADGVDEEDFFPPAVRRDAMRHFADLPADALAVLQTAAVLGPEAPYDVLARAVEHDDAALARSVDLVLDRLLLEEVPGAPDLTLRFRHPKLREALLADLTTPRRRFLEGRSAAARSVN